MTARLRNVEPFRIYAAVGSGRFHLKFLFVWETDVALLVADFRDTIVTSASGQEKCAKGM
jgi:hypothetical protein